MSLNLPNLNINVPIVGPDGKPTPQFQRLWQDTVNALVDQEASQDAILVELQDQQDQINDAITLINSNITYLNELGDWLSDVSNYILAEVAYIFCVLSKLVDDTGTDISGCGNPSDLPPWPGDRPDPPPEPTP